MTAPIVQSPASSSRYSYAVIGASDAPGVKSTWMPAPNGTRPVTVGGAGTSLGTMAMVVVAAEPAPSSLIAATRKK